MSDAEHEEGMDLTEREVVALAWRIVAHRVGDPADWLTWEDYPNLGEYAFEELARGVAILASDIEVLSGRHDRLMDIDSLELIERATS